MNLTRLSLMVKSAILEDLPENDYQQAWKTRKDRMILRTDISPNRGAPPSLSGVEGDRHQMRRENSAVMAPKMKMRLSNSQDAPKAATEDEIEMEQTL